MTKDTRTILAIDPGTTTGWARWAHGEMTYGTWELKNKTGRKTKPNEPKWTRLTKLWDNLGRTDFDLEPDLGLVVYEGAAGFMRGQAAVEWSHKFRAVIELYCGIHEIKQISVQPTDLKMFALGKGRGEKEEMIEVAKCFGYDGIDDNEADSVLLLHWALKHVGQGHKGREGDF